MAKMKYEEGSLMDFGVRGYENILKLSKSSLISEKLIGLNTLLFVLIISLSISFWINNGELFSVAFLVIFLVSLLFGFGLSLIYLPVLNLSVNFSGNKIVSLRRGLILLFIALPISVGGIIYGFPILIKSALAIVAFQLFGAFLLGITNSPENKEIKDVKVKFDFDKILGRAGSISSILGLIITIILLIFR